jgi:hypothetical protein
VQPNTAAFITKARTSKLRETDGIVIFMAVFCESSRVRCLRRRNRVSHPSGDVFKLHQQLRRDDTCRRATNSSRDIMSAWSNAGCSYILVSKLSNREMDGFVDPFRKGSPNTLPGFCVICYSQTTFQTCSQTEKPSRKTNLSPVMETLENAGNAGGRTKILALLQADQNSRPYSALTCVH